MDASTMKIAHFATRKMRRFGFVRAAEIAVMVALGLACAVLIGLPYSLGTGSHVAQAGTALLLCSFLFALTFMLARRTTPLSEAGDSASARADDRCELTIREPDGRVLRARAFVVRHADGGVTIFDVLPEPTP